jgi:hypothetical protein
VLTCRHAGDVLQGAADVEGHQVLLMLHGCMPRWFMAAWFMVHGCCDPPEGLVLAAWQLHQLNPGRCLAGGQRVCCATALPWVHECTQADARHGAWAPSSKIAQHMGDCGMAAVFAQAVTAAVAGHVMLSPVQLCCEYATAETSNWLVAWFYAAQKHQVQCCENIVHLGHRCFTSIVCLIPE